MLATVPVLIGPILLTASPAAQATPRHGVSPFKVCNPTTAVGQPYICSYAIQDTDGFHDSITVNDVDDVVTTASGAVDSGNILGSLHLIYDPGIANPSAMPTCIGGTGLGTTASPYVGATMCTIPWDAGIETANYTFYSVKPLDYNLPSHELTDLVGFTWDSLCESGQSCPTPNQLAQIGGSSFVQQLPSTTSTTIENGADTAVTAVAVGTPVHDFVTVGPSPSAPPSSPTPTGDVSLDWFTNGTCSGPPTTVSGPLALNGAGSVDATGFSFSPTSAGEYAFQAHYTTDPTNPAYTGSDGPCEPVKVADASISITPPSATNPVGATHTFTISVNGDPGTGSVTAPDGTKPTLSLANSSGATATITGGTCASSGTVAGSCTFTISSPTPGVTTATASVTLTLDGLSLTRSTTGPDSSGDSPPAVKNWVKGTTQTVTNVQLGGHDVTSVSAESTVTDEATVSGTGAGTPTGDVSFTFFTNSDCTGSGTPAGTESLTAGVADSSPEGPLAAGKYSFDATYNGNSNYLGSTGLCEPLTVNAPGLSVTKTADASPVSTGTAIGFTVVVQNSSTAGTGTATGVTLNDPLPAGTGINWSISPAYAGPGTCTISGSAPSQVLTCSFGDMAPGDSASVHISSTTNALSGGTYVNTATATATNSPAVPPASATIVVDPPSLSVTKTADATPVLAGTTIGFTVVVQNSSTAGTGTATGVTLNDPLPAGTGINWSISPAYAGPGTCTISGSVPSQVLTCSFGDMAPGASASVHISSTTNALSGGTYVNTATATATNSPAVPPASATIVVTNLPSLSVTKTADATPVPAGTTIGFTVVVQNSSTAGTGTATGVTLNDPLPAGTGINWSISPAYAGPGTCTISGSVPSQVLTCSFGDMAPGASASVHISSSTNTGSIGTYVNTATVKATNEPSVPPSSATIVVTGQPKTILTETVNPKVTGNGTSVTFTYFEKNTGNIGIVNVTVTGSLCGPATFVGSSDGNSTTLDPGATWTYTCTTKVANTGAKTITLVDNATANGTSVGSGTAAPVETARAKVKVKPGPAPCGISVTADPNPLVETGQSEVHTVVQVEACARFSGDVVNIDSSQLSASCAGGIVFGSLQPGATKSASGIQVVLDNDGNVTVSLDGLDCAPGPSVIEADLTVAPFLTSLTTLTALPPNVTPAGVVGYPANEVETGDTATSGNSDVYAVFYVETNPVYAEQTAEINSSQLFSRCLGGITWTSNAGTSVSHSSTATATIDNDGNAVFTFAGASCASGPSAVIAEILAGTNTTYTTTYTILPPALTPSV